MARIRTVKPELFQHHALYKAEVKHKAPLRTAFAGLFTACDREGRFEWVPETLKLHVLPFDPLDFEMVLDALALEGFINKYEAEGKTWGCIPSWKKHQVINNKEMASKIPSMIDALPTREPRVDHALPLMLGGKGTGTGRELEGNKPKTVAAPYGAEFELAWKAYPAERRASKKDAYAAWKKEKPNPQAVMDALRWQARLPDWLNDDRKYMPQFVNYLKKRRWEDERPYQKRDTSAIDQQIKAMSSHFKIEVNKHDKFEPGF